MYRQPYDLDRYLTQMRLRHEELAGKPIEQRTIDYHIEKVEFYAYHADTPDSRVETYFSMVCHDAHLASLHWWQARVKEQMIHSRRLAERLAAERVASPERVAPTPGAVVVGSASRLPS